MVGFFFPDYFKCLISYLSCIKNVFHFSVRVTRGIGKLGCEADLSVSQLKTVPENIQTLLACTSLSARGKNKARD